MKHFISYLLQLPVFVVLGVGIKLITGLGSWWCIPIAVILLVNYEMGSDMTKEVSREV